MDQPCTTAAPTRRSLLRRASCEVWLVGQPIDGGEVFQVLKTVGTEDGAHAEQALRREIDWHVRAAEVSPGVVPVVAVLDDAGGGHPGVLLRYLAEGSLEAAFAAGRAFEATEVIDGLVSLAVTLAELHDDGIVHGDVAPGNVLREDVAVAASQAALRPVLLSDFGSAGPGDAGPLATDLPAASLQIMATHGFAAPEVEAGGVPTPACDVFGLGALGLVWIAHVTRSSLSGSSDAETSATTSRGVSSAVQTRGGDLDAVVEWCSRLIAHDPEARPGDLRAAAHDLEVATTGWRPGTRTVEFGPRPPKAQAPATAERRGVASRGIAVLLAVVLVAMVAWLVRPHMAPSAAPRVAPVLHTVAAPPAPQRPGVALVGSAGCPRSASAGDVVPTRPRLADVLGTGCAQRVTWATGVLTVRSSGKPDAPVRFGLGQLGDVVFVGQWECALRATPRIYRPSTGEVIGYPEMPGASGVSAGVQPWRQQTGVVDGRVVVQRDAHGCNRLRVG